ncbi:Copper chaperone CopZ [Lactobacillus gasseri]|uniref:Copper chaperone CopZ n=8 Tax=Lactobacillus TaxID=1578 RepID=A0ABY3BF51_LACGS|nr:hypothetical protein CYJ88_08205 [Lactobacillus gasseri]PMB87244.1 hypothetical protein CK796_08195 [Lactobacillus gasseri]TQW15753.1 Copper chaperone CopZ [Lactobacillus gasseri]
MTSILPVKTEDRILTIKVEEIIKVEVEKTELTFYTTSAIVKTNDRLYQVLEKLNSDFVQVSKHGIINLNYLESLKPGFTGKRKIFMQKVMMKLGGMTCPSCLTKIEKAVEDVDGTDQIKVLFNAGKLKFMMNADKANVDDVKTAIEKMGYEVKGVKAKELD